MRIKTKPIFIVALIAALSIPTTLATGNDVIYNGHELEKYMFTIPAKFSSEPTTISVEGTWAENRMLQVTIHDNKNINTLFEKMKIAGNNNKAVSAQEIIEIKNVVDVVEFDLAFVNVN